MVNHQKEFGIVGLGKMGGNLALQALEKGMRIVGFTRGKPADELLQKGLIDAEEVGGFYQHLATPRVVFLYVPAGPVVETVIDDLTKVLEKGDIIVDGGNSYWGDSIRRYKRLKERGIGFIDLGSSGGVAGARNGACFMAGGEAEAVQRIEPILKELAVAGGYVHAGSPGAGHFVKLVHNGIEFGMLQAIGEGMDLLKRYREKLEIPDILHCWRNGSVIRSWLVDVMEEVYRRDGGLENIPAYIEDTGEVNWLVGDAMHMEVPVPVIAQSVMQLFSSRDQSRYWARSIAMMRHGFGGHPYGKEEGIVKERREGRLGGFYRDTE